MKHARLAQSCRRSRFTGVESMTRRLDANKFHSTVVQIMIVGTRSIAASSYAGNDPVGMRPARHFLQLLLHFLADHRLETCDHIRIGMRAYNRTDNIVR